jgi:ABC transporter with metal-binding/Fe-S-binding domain ATP-binding protein
MKVAVLFSGGKDSCLALHKVIENGDEVKYLLNIIPSHFDSFMFHKPYLNLLEKQAEELGIRIIFQESKAEKEEELVDLTNLIKKVEKEVQGIVVGGIASNYQGKRVEKICNERGLKFIAPLWNYTPKKLWGELLDLKFKIILTKVSCDGLKKDWLGKIIDKVEFEELEKLSKKYKFRLDFEGGEAESAVLWMPKFKKEIKIKADFDKNIISEGEYRHFFSKVDLFD